MNLRLKLLLLFSVFFVFQISASAQDTTLSEDDKKAIQYKSRDFIKELASLMNIICDPTIEDVKRTEIINNSYNANANQIFVDGDVIIEDDIDPNFTNWENPKNLKVSRYLKDLDLFYQKSERPTISFDNIQTFEVKKGSYIFMPLYFETSFTGKHLVINKPYQTVKRVATIMARKEGNLWKPLIVSIVFYNPQVHTFVEEAQKKKQQAGIIAGDVLDPLNKKELELDTTENTIEDSVISLVADSTTLKNENVADNEEELKTASFNQYPEIARKGKTQYISWDKGDWNNAAKLELYQDSNLINVINLSTDINNQLWQVPKETPLGSGYQLRLSNVADQQKEIFSPEFQIKRGFPLGLKILGAAAIVGTAAVLLSGGGGGDDPGPGGGDIPTVNVEDVDPFEIPGSGN